MQAIDDANPARRRRLGEAGAKRGPRRAVGGGHSRRREKGSRNSGASGPGNRQVAPAAAGTPVRLEYHEAAWVMVLHAHLLGLERGVGRRHRTEACQARRHQG